MNDDTQPTNEAILKAHGDCIRSFGICGAYTENLHKLRVLRDARYSWVGKEDSALMFMVDRYLRENQA